MGTAHDESFDVIVDCLQDSIVRDAREIERLERRGRVVNAELIKRLRGDCAKRIAAIEFVKQQGWTPGEDFPDRSHHWEGIISQ